MVKTDVKHNYYADLELPTNASIDDVRRAYRKLALQYHPDRNSGREEECVPKFQAIQAANEVLGDVGSKQKYDTDRRKAGLYPTGGPTFNPRQPAPGNPYAANSAYPPPPRRTPYARPPPPTPGGPASTGADKFSHFPRPSPTARRDNAQNRTDAFKAWQNMHGTQERQTRFNQPGAQQQPPQPQAQRPRPQPPPRPEAKYRNVPPRFEPEGVDKNQTAWASFRQANAGKQGMPGAAKTPKKPGFDPNQPGSDERPTNSHYAARNPSVDFGRGQPGLKVPPPPAGPPPAGARPTTPVSPISPTAQRPGVDPTRPYSSHVPDNQVPFTEGNRNRTPYTSFIREKTDLGGGLRRAHSTRDTTTLGSEESSNRGRARSTSPMHRQRASDGQAQAPGPKKPFVVYSSSEASGSDPDMTQEAGDSSSTGREQRPGTAPNPAPPFDRPKMTPTPPSSRFNGSTPNMQYSNGATNGSHPDNDQPSMQQRATPNMYAPPYSLPNSVASGSARISRSNSTWRARNTWSSAGAWAVPSSLSPFSKDATYSKNHKFAQHDQSTAGPYVTAADVNFTNAAKEEQNAYLRFQAELQKQYDYVPGNLDMGVFLKLASTAANGASSGDAKLDEVLHRALNLPNVGHPHHNNANEGLRANSFAFPHDDDLFTQTNARNRSEENIDTKFSPEGWSGAFMGDPDYFAPPASTGPSRKQPSPTRRNNARSNRTPSEQFRSAPMDTPPATAPPGDVPPRPWGSDGSSNNVPPQPASAEVRFSKDEWEKTFQDASWSWPPPPPKSGSPIKSAATPASRKQSQGKKGSKAANKNSTGAKHPQPAHVVDEENTVEVEGVDAVPQTGAPLADDDDDAMDIDNTPPTQTPTAQADQMPSTAQEKEARLYSVPPSTWRQQQEQKQKHLNGHRKSSSAGNRRLARKTVNDGTKLSTNLDDLRNVEPITKSAGGGLEGFGDMSSTLPFESQASTTMPNKVGVPQNLNIPAVPKPPLEPTKLNKASWQNHAKVFGDYLIAFHNFNGQMIAHFTAREKLAESRFMNGMGWLEAAGDTTGMSAAPSGFGSYLAGVKEDEPVRETWNVGCEKHGEAVKSFERIRERVRQLALGGMLPEN